MPQPRQLALQPLFPQQRQAIPPFSLPQLVPRWQQLEPQPKQLALQPLFLQQRQAIPLFSLPQLEPQQQLVPQPLPPQLELRLRRHLRLEPLPFSLLLLAFLQVWILL